MKINKIEDIYPLTIISMRYGGKIVILNMESDNINIHNLQLGEESYYNLDEYLKSKISPCNYGVGETIFEAFENYKLNENIR